MKPKINFFVVPVQFLEPDSDPKNQSFSDQLLSHEFHNAVREISRKYNTDYPVTRKILIEVYRSQATFGLYGICCDIFKGRGWATSRFIFKCGQIV